MKKSDGLIEQWINNITSTTDEKTCLFFVTFSESYVPLLSVFRTGNRSYEITYSTFSFYTAELNQIIFNSSKDQSMTKYSVYVKGR